MIVYEGRSDDDDKDDDDDRDSSKDEDNRDIVITNNGGNNDNDDSAESTPAPVSNSSPTESDEHFAHSSISERCNTQDENPYQCADQPPA